MLFHIYDLDVASLAIPSRFCFIQLVSASSVAKMSNNKCSINSLSPKIKQINK